MAVLYYVSIVLAFTYIGGILIGSQVLPWWFLDQYVVSDNAVTILQMIGGGILFLLALKLMRFAIHITLGSIMASFVNWPMKTLGIGYVIASGFGLVPYNWIIMSKVFWIYFRIYAIASVKC